jgi:hypothetical protein
MEIRDRRRIGTRVVVALSLFVCVMIASACASSSRASSSSTGLDYKSITIDHASILLVPSIEAGSAGWCVTKPNGVVCPEGRPRGPVIVESWSSSNPPPVTAGYALTSNQAATVSIDGGQRIPTRSESALPDGLRAVAVEIHGWHRPQSSDATVHPRSVPRFIPMNVKGEVLQERIAPQLALLATPLPTQSLPDAAHPTIGTCQIETALPLVGLVADGGSVLTQVRPRRGLLGEAFLSCASTSYSLDGWSPLAGVLLNASQPGAKPSLLPGMQSLSGHPGIFEAPSINGGMVARRVPGAWLVVERAPLQQRVTLLEDLRGRIHI